MSSPFLADLFPEAHQGPTNAFRPVARYNPYLDILMYLQEDCSYRADRVDVYLTVLWHPHEERLVGLKLKGFRFLFRSLQHIMGLKDEEWLPLVKALEIALVGGVAQSLMDDVESERIQKRYEEARVLAGDVGVSPEEWARAA